MKCSCMKRQNKKLIVSNRTGKLFKKSFKLTSIKIRKKFKLKAKYLEKRKKENYREKMFGILDQRILKGVSLIGLKIKLERKF